MKKTGLLLLFFYQTSLAQTSCDSTRLPVVFVHGFMGGGDNWATQVQRFSSRGYCEDRLFVFDWNTIGRQNSDSLMNVFIDGVLRKTNSGQIDLVAHSAGGGLSYAYLKDSLHARKVAHYIHIGSMKMPAPPGKHGEVPTMNIYSVDDMVMRGASDIFGATNIRETGYDHLQVATCAASFSHIYAFLTGSRERVNTAIDTVKDEMRIMGGKAMLLAENTPLSQDSFRVFLIDPRTGTRISNKGSFKDGSISGWRTFGIDGSWGLQVHRDNYTEFEMRTGSGRPLFYYFEPLVRNNRNVYLRGLPTRGMVATLLGKIPNDSIQTALVIFSGNSAVIAGRDTLAIDSIPLSLPELMPASKTSIATFLYDDGDRVSSGKALKSLSMAPFLTGVDVFIKSEEGKTMRIYYNGRSIVLPKRKSREGIMIVVFN